MKPDALEALGSYYSELLPPVPEKRGSSWVGLAVPVVAAVGAYVFLAAVGSMPVEAGPRLASPPSWSLAAQLDPVPESGGQPIGPRKQSIARRLWWV